MKRDISKECLNRIRNRNSLRRKAKRSNLESDWEKWRKEKNLVNNMIRKESNIRDKAEQIAAESDLT